MDRDVRALAEHGRSVVDSGTSLLHPDGRRAFRYDAFVRMAQRAVGIDRKRRQASTKPEIEKLSHQWQRVLQRAATAVGLGWRNAMLRRARVPRVGATARRSWEKVGR